MTTKKDIESLIIQVKKSTLINHFKDAFFYNTTKYSGCIKDNEVHIWCSTPFLRGTYPIFIFKFDEKGQLLKMDITKNPYHKLMEVVTILFFLVVFLLLYFFTDKKTAIVGTVGISVIGISIHLILDKFKKQEVSLLRTELNHKIETLHSSKPASEMDTVLE